MNQVYPGPEYFLLIHNCRSEFIAVCQIYAAQDSSDCSLAVKMDGLSATRLSASLILVGLASRNQLLHHAAYEVNFILIDRMIHMGI